MKYRLLAMDLDGTLTNSQKQVTDRTCEVIWAYIKKGGSILLASGRPTYGVMPVAERLNLPESGGYILSYNGAELYDCRTGECLFRQPLPSDAPAKISAFAKQNGLSVLTYHEDCIITETPQETYTMVERDITKMKIIQAEDFARAVDFPVGKCLITGEPSRIREAEQRMLAKYGREYTISTSAPFFLEVQANGIDKGKTMEVLAKRLKLSQADTAAFGDSYNDLPMLKYAGLSVVMENGVEELKEMADIVAPSNDEDGVAAVVKRLMEE